MTRDTVLRCGTLIDGQGGPPQSNVAILVTGQRISQILPLDHAPDGPGLNVIHAESFTVMPGLFDIHVHLTCVTDPAEPHALFSLLSASPQMLALHAAKNARILLEAGFTTVRDLAGIVNTANLEALALKRAIELDLVPGPRIFAAGWIGQTAGHLDMIPPFTWPRPPGYTADGPWEIRKLARTYLRSGVDWLKTTASGSFGPIEDFSWRNYTRDELEALADEAHAAGRRFAVHVDTPAGIKESILAGADTLEHCSFLDDESVELMVKHQTYMVPTLTLGSERTLNTCRQAGTYTPAVLDQLQRIGDGARASFHKAHRAGVKIATGSDIYRSMRDQYGKNAYEITLMVECGMTPMEALVASTRTAAEALGCGDRLGTVQPGKLADLLILDGNPLENISLLQDISKILLVIKDGKIEIDRRTSHVLESATPPRRDNVAVDSRCSTN